MTTVLEGEHVPKHDASPKGEARRECAAKEERSDDAEGGLRVGVGDSVGAVGRDEQIAEGVRRRI